jgi:glutamate racemase
MIGFFDSGSGGLSVLSHFRTLAPDADIVYFGDIKNAPYGEKSSEELSSLTRGGVAVLREAGATSIVSACNSVSTSILAGAAGDMPFVEMSMPTAKYMQQFAGKRFLLLATPATVASGMYEHALADVVSLDSIGVPGLAGAIEFGEPSDTVASLVRDALAPKLGQKYDGVILGCTHYPLARKIIEPIIAELFGNALIIDPGEPVAGEASRAFAEKGSGITRFVISKDSVTFRLRVGAMLPAHSYEVHTI